jgi:hypothetical protein
MIRKRLSLRKRSSHAVSSRVACFIHDPWGLLVTPTTSTLQLHHAQVEAAFETVVPAAIDQGY